MIKASNVRNAFFMSASRFGLRPTATVGVTIMEDRIEMPAGLFDHGVVLRHDFAITKEEQDMEEKKAGRTVELDKSFSELPGFYRSILPRIREDIANFADDLGLVAQVDWNDNQAEVSFVSKDGTLVSPVRFLIPGPGTSEKKKASWSEADIYYLFASQDEIGHNGYFTMRISHDDSVPFSDVGSIEKAINAGLVDLRDNDLLPTFGHPKCVSEIFADAWDEIERFADNAVGGEIHVDVIRSNGLETYSFLDEEDNEVELSMIGGPVREWLCLVNNDEVGRGKFDEVFREHVLHEVPKRALSARR